MSPFTPREAGWTGALLDPHAPVPPGLRTWNGSDPGTRFDVHRNNVVVTLVSALAGTFTVVRDLLGPDRFAEAARRYVRAEPPRSPVLAEYGATWSDFLVADAASPALADLARLEYCRVQAFHAADATPLAPARLAAALERPDDLAGSRWGTHPSLHVIVSDHPIVDLWASRQVEGGSGSVDPQAAQSALVGRDDDDVLVLPLPRPAALFVAALQRDETLARAVEQAGDDLDLPATLALLLTHGWLVEPAEPRPLP